MVGSVTGWLKEFTEEISCPTNLSPSILCNRETFVTGEPVVSTGFAAGALPVMMGKQISL